MRFAVGVRTGYRSSQSRTDRISASQRLSGVLQSRRSLAADSLGWLFVLPALVMYGLFVLEPLGLSVWYSLYRWDGIGPATWVGITNYVTVLTDPVLLQITLHAFELIIFFSLIPVGAGLIVATVIFRAASGGLGSAVRAAVFLPQVIPLVAAGIAWSWMFASTGLINQALSAIGLGALARPWLGDFATALPAVGIIGAWVLFGFCTVLLITGMSKIDPALFESARLDGAGPVQEFLAVILPSLRHEIGVCLTVTVIAALATFDIVYISTLGGPGLATMVPGVEIYRLAFAHRQVGLASALAIVLMLVVWICVLPIQRLTRADR